MGTQWEYMQLNSVTTEAGMEELALKLTALGSLGWEMCGFAGIDRTIGFNAMVAILKRQVAGFPEPADAGWHGDPSRRFERRYYDGLRWTEHVTTAGVEQGKDYPNIRPSG